MPRQVHRGEEEIAELIEGTRLLVQLGLEFRGFFGKFFEEAIGVRPVEAYFGGSGTEFRGFDHRRNVGRHIVQKASSRPGGT